jgi:D-lysine oxidase
MPADIMVLGAGIVGICVALHLQKRSRSVVLVDRRGAAEETSFGNAGLIQREGVYPYGFPHDFGALARYGLNRTIDAYYHPSALPRLAPFLLKYWRYSRPARHAEVARHYSKLIEHCVAEHDALATEARASGFLHRTGWINRGGIRAARRDPHAGAARTRRADRARSVSARRAAGQPSPGWARGPARPTCCP